MLDAQTDIDSGHGSNNPFAIDSHFALEGSVSSPGSSQLPD
jgi:hypothetical protein